MPDRTMLQFDYEKVRDQIVTGVLGHSEDASGWLGIAIIIGEHAVHIEVDSDTDEITVRLETTPVQEGFWRPVPDLVTIVGEKLGWCWVGRNYLGYLDTFTLSVSGLEPQFMFVAAASVISIRRVVAAS